MEKQRLCKTDRRLVLLYIQLFCVFLLILSGQLEPSLVQMAYCVVVFTSPLLLLTYADLYVRENIWHWTLLPFVWELGLALLFVGAMLYGIFCMEPGEVLFLKLVLLYIADTILCALGILWARLKNR